MNAASLVVSVVALVLSAAGILYARRQASAATSQADDAKLQAAAALVQADAARVQADAAVRQLAHQERRQEREQAYKVDLSAAATLGSANGVLPADSPEYVYKAVIRNGSELPIRNVSARLLIAGQEPSMPAVTSLLLEVPIAGGATADMPVQQSPATHRQLMGPGERAAFVFAVECNRHPVARMEARFTDDERVSWEIDHELHRVKLPEREGW